MPSTTTDRLVGLTTSVAVKAPCRAATTGHITLSGEQTVDGVDLVEGDRVLVKNQNASVDNGIYKVGTATWTRAADFDGSLDTVGGTQIHVIEGTLYGNSFWGATGSSTSTVVGTDNISFSISQIDAQGVYDALDEASAAVVDAAEHRDAAEEAALSASTDAASAAASATLASGYASAAAIPANRLYESHADALADIGANEPYYLYNTPVDASLEAFSDADTETPMFDPSLQFPTLETLRLREAGGRLGGFRTKTTDGDGTGFGFVDRDELSEQLVATVDVSLTTGKPDTCQFTATSTTPTGAYTGVSDEAIKITFDTFAMKGLTVPYLLEPGRAYVITYLPTSILDAAGGIGIGFDPVAPVPGSTTVRQLASGFFAMVWRCLETSSSVRILRDHTGTADPVGPVISNSNGGVASADFARTAGTEFSLRLELDSAGTTATIYYLDENLDYIEGSGGRAVTTITQVPVGSYLWIGVEDGVTAAQPLDVTIGPVEIYAPSSDVPRRYHADASLIVTGTGTQDDPFLEPDEIARYLELDRTRRQHRIKLKPGTYTRPLVIPNTALFDELHIYAPVGTKAIINPCDLLDQSGWTAAGGGYTNLWMRDALFGFTGLTNGASCVIEVPGSNTPNLSQTYGTGSYTHTVPWYLYTRYSPNTSAATVNADPGSYTMHSTGPYAGKILLHARASADPNSLTFNRPLASNGVAVLCPDETDWNMPRVILEGIEVGFTANDAFRFERCMVEHGPLIARATALYGAGFEYDECFVDAWGSLAEGTAGDHVNMSGSFGGLPEDLRPSIKLEGFRMLGTKAADAVSPGGDNISNHVGQDAYLYDCYGLAAGKDGLSAGGDFRMVQSRFDGAGNAGIHLYPTTGVAHTGSVQSCKFRGGHYGLQATGDIAGANPGAAATFDVWDSHFADNTIADVFSNGTDALVTMRGEQQTDGTPPPNYKVEQAGGVIDHVQAGVMP